MAQETMTLVINCARPALRDTLKNKGWVLAVVAAVIVWTIISAAAFHYVETAPIRGWLDSFYFTVINITTVGFGDIFPASSLGKLLAVANSLFGGTMFGLFVAIISAGLQPSEFKGESKIDCPQGPGSSPDEKPAPRTAEPPQTPEQEILTILRSMRALVRDGNGPFRRRILEFPDDRENGGSFVELHLLLRVPGS
jgi:Ion channel